jgi:sortase B
MRRRKRTRRRTRRSPIWWVAWVVCSAVWICCGMWFLRFFSEEKEIENLYNNIASIHDSKKFGSSDSEVILPDIGTTNNSESSVTVGNTVTEKVFLKECEELYNLNPDLVGWISIPGTNINYPVVQSSPENRDFYLSHDFYKRDSRYGCIYASADCDVFAPSDNVVLYGHRMRDGSMFADLGSYVDYEYWVKHQRLVFDTIYEHRTYQIVAVFKTHASTGFKYNTFVDADSEKEFEEFIREIYSRRFYDTGYGVEFGDNILCLSTCEYTLGDGRLVVVAKLVS